MVSLLLRLLRRGAMRKMDPLQVAMTGVRMGEKVLQIGCDDRALLSGIAAKVGLSGAAALAAFDDDTAARGRAVGASVGALIDVHAVLPGAAIPVDSDLFDMVVVDDTAGAFAGLADTARTGTLREAFRAVRGGGRVEVVEGLGGGLLRREVARPAGYDAARALETAGFKPVRLLAEKDGFRFVEGLKAARPQ